MHTKRNLATTLALLVLILALAGGPSLAQVPPPETITLVLKAPAYQLKPVEDGLTAIDAEGCGASGSVGQPLLPHQMVDVALPPDVAWNTLALDVRDVQTAALPGTYKLGTVAPALPDTGPALDVGVRLDRALTPLTTEAPPIARIATTGQMRKWHVARVDFCPFQYDTASGQLRVVEQATVELRFARTGERANADLLADTVMDDVAAGQFVNYAAARAWYPPTDRASNVLYDYAILTTSAIWSGSSQLNSFITHKRSQGHHVWVVTESGYGGGTGRAEKVRQWLQNNYATYGIKYVLLIGDPAPDGTGTTDLPMKQCWPVYYGPGNSDNIDAPTDYFFADLTGNWDKDGDLIYGEYTGDWNVPGGVDLFPEVYVGRIPFYDNYADLDAILQKTISYETATDISWRKSILLPMSYHYLNLDFAPLAEQMWDDYLSATGYSRWRMYMQGHSTCAADDSIYTSDEELLANKVRDRWAAHDYGIVCWAAHGNQDNAKIGWGEPDPGPNCWDGILFDSSQAGSLDDAHPAFTYQCSCDNSWPENSNNLAYAILKRGGIATVGATRVSFPSGSLAYGEFDYDTSNAAIGYEYVKRVVNGYTASEALFQARFISTPGFDQRLINFYVFNLYGDPDVRITDRSTQGRAYLSIPAAAFQPAIDGNDYENHGRFLKRLSAGASGSGHYLAPVQLPHGATVTAVTFHWYDATSGPFGSAELKRTNRDGSWDSMTDLLTFDSGGYGSFRDDSINHATVDNVNYTYWVDWSLASTPDVMGCSVTIEYIPPPAASKGYLSLPAAAFKPFEDGYDFDNAGVWLAHYHGPGGYLLPISPIWAIFD